VRWGALIRTAHELTGDHERAHVLGWQVTGMIADAANLHPVEDEERGWSLTMLKTRADRRQYCGPSMP
jgi:hypothetical protein